MSQAGLFKPVLSTILRDRRLSSIICGAALLQLLLTLIGAPGWTCPVFHTFGIPCPGCGMTRATVFLFRGNWKEAITMHAFAPLFLVALTVIAFATVGPRPGIDRMIAKTEVLERYTGITVLLLGGLIVYWLARLLFLQTAFVRLIQG
jgi:hypothetical protein